LTKWKEFHPGKKKVCGRKVRDLRHKKGGPGGGTKKDINTVQRDQKSRTGEGERNIINRMIKK